MKITHLIAEPFFEILQISLGKSLDIRGTVAIKKEKNYKIKFILIIILINREISRATPELPSIFKLI